MLNCTVTKNGKPLTRKFYTWDEKARTFSTTESGLILNFIGLKNVTFKTGSNCTIKAGPACTFKTYSNCTFKTGSDCTFKTGSGCTFDTDSGCTFDTDSGCTFKTGPGCTFKTSSGCTFRTGSDCTFKTDSDCTFDTDYNCIFNTHFSCTFKTNFNCIVIRRDTFEIIALVKDQKIKLANRGIKGFKVLEEHKIMIDGREVFLSEENFKALKKSLLKN
jgi:hypothetical protein